MSVFNKVIEQIKNKQSQTSICFSLTDEEIEEIFKAGVNHGIFEEKNYGLHDRKNSVYGFIGTLQDLN